MASSSGWTTCPGWAWTASGCRRRCRPRTRTGATTSPTTWACIPSSAPWPTWTGSSPRRARGACGCCWTWCRTTPAPRTPGSSTRPAAGTRPTATTTCGPTRRPDGGPPNNWLDATGHSAWAWHEPTGQYYLHLFLDSQADLNWFEPAVHREFDADPPVLVRPRGGRVPHRRGARPVQGRAAAGQPPGGSTPGPLAGRFGQAQKYSANRPETHEVFRDWRQIAEGYRPPRLLLGETWVGDLDGLARFYGNDDELQLAFNFPFVFSSFAARRACPRSSPRRAPSCRPAPARCGRRPTTTSAASRAAGAGETSARPGSPCWCWPRCPAPPCCTTATRSG